VYRARDGHWLVISGTTDPQVARLLTVMGCDTDAHRARFGTSASRLAHADELDALVAQWVAEHEHTEVVDRLLQARVPAAAVNDLGDLVEDPHVVARRSVVPIDDPELGSVLTPAPFPLLSATPGAIRRRAPALGEHNEEVGREWLGLDRDEARGLQEAGGR
jgi:crotonobetainyl-CoA:carnitine CoA-transferase CaiB-like acyl-CoA transferase